MLGVAAVVALELKIKSSHTSHIRSCFSNYGLTLLCNLPGVVVDVLVGNSSSHSGLHEQIPSFTHSVGMHIF
jgi:hypothetical protein